MKTIQTKGKRKRSIARATMKAGTGIVTINGRLLQHVGDNVLMLRMQEPLLLAPDLAKSVNIHISVNGGGVNGQADASRVAIARALVQHDGNLKTVFDDYDRLLLVADVRRKEVRKPNDSKARAARQKSYR